MSREDLSRIPVRIVAAGIGVLLAPPMLSQAQSTQRASVDSSSLQANGTSAGPALSADGRFLVFESIANNLVAGDTNATSDVFLRDRQLGTTERISIDSAGQQANADSHGPTVSDDGRFVVFYSLATNLVAGDTNSVADVFLRDRQLGTTVRVSLDSSGTQSNGGSFYPVISPDGRYVLFESAASDLVAGDSNNATDVFVRDLQLGTNDRASLGSGGVQANQDSGVDGYAMSADGRFVVFESLATNLVSGDTNAVRDVFVRDRQLGTTERSSTDAAGAQGNLISLYPSISLDGRFVAFESDASNLVGGDTNAARDIFLRDRALGTIVRVSVDTAGGQASNSSNWSSVSPDGQHVSFGSFAANLVAGDSNGLFDVFVRDLSPGVTTRVSVGPGGVQALGASNSRPSSSADGGIVVFYSEANNLIAGDTNAAGDVFTHDRHAVSFTSLCDPGVGALLACPCSNPPSGLGRGCDNSAATGGARLLAVGGASLAADTLVFSTSGEKPTATSIVMQGTSLLPAGSAFGQGVRCAGGTLKRLFTKTASGGSITAPNFGSGDPTISARSSSLGDPILAGQSRFYLVYYRDPVVLGGCAAANSFNATQTGQVGWWP